MSKVSLINVLIGWLGLVIAAFAGVFIASDISTEFINSSQMSETWKSVIIQSSHGHSNMFSMIHILFGLSLSYSVYTSRVKFIQTIFLFMGLFAMGPLMYLRSNIKPTPEMGWVEVSIGVCLSLSLLSMCSHCLGIASKFFKRPYTN
jgi:hypothetical protein